MTEITVDENQRTSLGVIEYQLDRIEADLCNYLAGELPTDAGSHEHEYVFSLLDEAGRHLRRLRFELQSSGMTGAVSSADIPGFNETEECVDDHPLSLPVARVTDAMQPMLSLISAVVGVRTLTDTASVNSKLLAIDHFAAMTLDRIEKCREIAAA